MQLTLPSLFFKHPFFLECSRRGGDFNRLYRIFFFVMQNGNTIKNQSIRKRFCHFSFPSSSANSFLFPFWYEQMNCTNMLWFKREWNKFCHLWVTSAHFVFEKISSTNVLRHFTKLLSHTNTVFISFVMRKKKRIFISYKCFRQRWPFVQLASHSLHLLLWFFSVFWCCCGCCCFLSNGQNNY